MRYAIQRLSSDDEFEGIRGEWDALCNHVQGRRFFHRWEWYRSVREHLLAGEIDFYCGYGDAGLVAVFPLMRSRSKSAVGDYTALEIPFHSDIFLADFIVHLDHATPALFEALIRFLKLNRAGEWDVLRLRRISEGSSALRMLRAAGTRVALTDDGVSAFCDCSDRASLNKLSKKNQRNLQRLYRKATREAGRVEIESFEDRKVESGFEQFVEVESAGWKGPSGAGTAIGCVPEQEAFYRRLLNDFGALGRARVDLLRIGGQHAAGQVALREANSWGLLKIGYDPAFGAYGPGSLLFDLFLEKMAARADVSEVSLVTGPKWASHWHMSHEPVYDACFYRDSPKGYVLWAGRRVKNVAKCIRDWLGLGPDASDA